MSFRGSVVSEVFVRDSCIGGRGPLGARAYSGVVASDQAGCRMDNCVVEACFLGAAG